ncbi:MAG: hypothetical protein P0Y53_15870 [Candidatus Pseudobacter hemicellulosilyticus]|uniref:Uncharacterized protein n=1 Tax=Candidatus Pseudobacter hemicellulosilyticus TaxID=3121375 RepID=A0AAJ6BGB9_9BACT|nr:MAG: hypothetical protein P0Y53_15870 [Pseudobacter sp.]
MARIKLPHGCSCSQPTVYPKNYSKPSANMEVSWYIHYRFFDPSFACKYPDGKLVIKTETVDILNEQAAGVTYFQKHSIFEIAQLEKKKAAA